MKRISQINDALLAEHFHWPSDSDQVWRHFSDYALTDKKGNVVEDMLVEEGTYRAKGTLLARPGSNYLSMEQVEIMFSTYAIDFGRALDDAARGYWVKGLQKSGADVWYKMEKPHESYSKYSDQMEYKVDKFLALHDTLTKGNYAFVTMNPITQLVACKLHIAEFHRLTDGAFDLTFVGENIEFVLDHLKNNVDPVKSIKFLESIVEMGNMKKKDFLALFPPLRVHYRMEEKENRRREIEDQFEKRRIEMEEKAAIEDEIPKEISVKKKKREREVIDEDSNQGGSEIDSMRSQGRSEVDNMIKKKKFIHTPSPASIVSIEKMPIENSYYKNEKFANQKSSFIDKIADFTYFKSKPAAVVMPVRDVSLPPPVTRLKWADAEGKGIMYTRFYIDYEELFNSAIGGAPLKSIYKKSNGKIKAN